MSLTRVLRFVAGAGDTSRISQEKMARLVAWGEGIGEGLAEGSLGNLIRMEFEAERALLLHCAGSFEKAAEMIEGVVLALEEFPDQSFSVFRAVRFRVGQCCGLLGAGRWKGPGDRMPPLAMVGLIADFTDPASKVLDFPPASYPELWSILAVYAAKVQNCDVARRCAKRGRAENGSEHYYVAINQGIEAVYLCDLLEDDVGAAFGSGLEWTRVMAIGMAAGLDADDRIRQKMNMDRMFVEYEPRVVDVWGKMVAIFLLEPLFMTLCSAGGSQRPDFDEWRRAIPALLGPAFHDRLQPTTVPLMKIKFGSLPDRMTVRVFLVAQKHQRYDTLGDWIWTETGVDIRLSREFAEQDPRYGALLLVHEFVEAMLCRSTGVSTGQVDAFDMSFKGDGEPGDDPSAPYHRQHRAAEAAERALAAELGVNWRRYLRD